jgi:hypothetical protein
LNIGFEDFVQTLAARGTASASKTPVLKGKQPTSIRFKPATRHFVECQAESLGTSQQSVIGMIIDGVAEATLGTASGLDKARALLRTMQQRFFELFEAHEVDLPGIVSILKGHEFRLSALSSSEVLLDLLTTDTLRYLADLFCIEASWLSGASDCIRSLPACSSDWHSFCQGIVTYGAHGWKPDVLFFRRMGADFERARSEADRGRGEPSGIVIELHRTTGDGVAFRTYDASWGLARWNDWRCRYSTKLVVAFCKAAGFEYAGYEVPQDMLDRLQQGKIMPAAVIRHNTPHQVWQPDSYVGEPLAESDEWQSVQDYSSREAFDSIVKEALLLRDSRSE